MLPEQKTENRKLKTAFKRLRMPFLVLKVDEENRVDQQNDCYEEAEDQGVPNLEALPANIQHSCFQFISGLILSVYVSGLVSLV